MCTPALIRTIVLSSAGIGTCGATFPAKSRISSFTGFAASASAPVFRSALMPP